MKTKKSKAKLSPKKKERLRLDRIKNEIKLSLNIMYEQSDIKNTDYHDLFNLVNKI